MTSQITVLRWSFGRRYCCPRMCAIEFETSPVARKWPSDTAAATPRRTGRAPGAPSGAGCACSCRGCGAAPAVLPRRRSAARCGTVADVTIEPVQLLVSCRLQLQECWVYRQHNGVIFEAARWQDETHTCWLACADVEAAWASGTRAASSSKSCSSWLDTGIRPAARRAAAGRQPQMQQPMAVRQQLTATAGT